MKYSPTGWAAEVKDDDGQPSYLLTVERWSESGEAMVAHESGKLVPASTAPGFVKIVPLTRTAAVVSATPGWTVRADMIGDKAPFTAPVAAWVMDGEGRFWPVIAVGTDERGGTANPDPAGELSLRPVSSTRFHIVPPIAS
jgi:hypothetical protein